ncbi:GNAT family N-acetyltransferase [Shimia thalassica]|uniref:GNAT family N-acetyltransferase n=1 Tax=Shimia thalassica TaxID=1715693 RepID=UPI0026E3E693|nr:GNAT family N-acetyltransferase [Shimia thalassica]MDO6484022.1 GNAT family N-acetyltransferase [Shimia thalassica]
MIETRVLKGCALDTALDDVALLRINVFRAFPYLYDGDLEYERTYLNAYRESDRAVLVGAFDGNRLVGAATGTPLSDHSDDFSAAFGDSDIRLTDVFYCAESVLLPEYRGQGIGHAYFDLREAHARDHGFKKSAFCGVLRPEEHPLCPPDYVPLNGFWKRRGYAPMDGVIAHFAWKDLGADSETLKPLQFWIRDL